ncbi:hypothetical protein CPB84DRAFT_1809499 [Gymnopilus junonius]|uniref:F-box domain-containing protein n=1 Tax=Gymnopilus junonius TaxID=109634 RepID=A0A9P5N7J6_GYMJU|nr:hypothetical protein CPB84DRAFT_1809499 [Gymnopilus junonius]
MISCIKLPEVTTLDPYMHSLRARFNLHLVSSKKNVVNTMPPEILGEIFLKLHEDDDMVLHHSVRPLVSRSCHSNPLLFGRVCSYWRNVALNTPALWSRIYILKPQRSQVQQTQLWLERAGTYPLDLSMWTPAVEQFDQSAADDIMSLFMERRQYWKSISFAIGFQTFGAFSKMVKSEPCLHLLESATLAISKSGSEVDDPDAMIDSIWKAIHACTVLRYVDWRSFYRRDLPEHCPWDQLTGLTLSTSVSFKQLLNVLSISPQLEFLQAHWLISSDTECSEIPTTLSPVTHLHLKKFYITLKRDGGPLFRLLSLPAVQVLKIRNSFLENNQRDMIGFQEFLDRSNSIQLTDFELEDICIDDGDLQKYLGSPGLKHLRCFKLFTTKITDKIVNQLAYLDEEGNHKVLPALQVLDITSDRLQTKDGNLSDMITSRFYPSRKQGNLSKILLLMDNIGPVDLTVICKLFGQGLEGSVQ